MASAPPRTPLARLIRRIALLLFAVVLALFAAESFVRIADPLGVSQFSDMLRYNTQLLDLVGGDRIIAQKKDASVAFRDFTITTNAQGFRNPKIETRKPDGTRRILFLGDSVVLGWGARDEDVFVRRAETELRAANQDPRIECVNTGQNQFDTVQEAALLADLLAAGFQPDAVLLVFVYNDILLTREVVRQVEAAAAGAASRPAPGALAHVWHRLRADVFEGLNNLWIYRSVVASGAERNDRESQVREAMAGDAPGWQACRQALIQMRDLCRSRGIPFHLLDHTDPKQLPQLEEFCRSSEIPWHPFFFTPAESALPIRHSAADPHANALGHELLLHKLRPVLRALGFATK